MLTRLHVDGFKNLLDFHCDFAAYTCIAGANGVGKSNVFDAIRFLSLLADHSFMDAAQMIRGIGQRTADPRELFWTDGSHRADRMQFAAEMIVPLRVKDDFGRDAKPTTTFLRYEIDLAFESSESNGRGGRIVLASERLTHIRHGEAAAHMPWPHVAKTFRSAVVVGRRAGREFISTTEEEGAVTIKIHQDGGSRGQPRPSAAHMAPRTIVSTTTTSSDPTILAVRREMQSWRLLALEPHAMRSPDSFMAPARIDTNGAHLAATLYRLAHESGQGGAHRAEEAYARVARRVARLVAVDAIRVDRDPTREILTLEARQPGHGFLSARALSDGTLRFLAICILAEDPESVGLITMEEPENGIHPERMPAMVELLRALPVDARSAPGPANPMRQLIVNTHSPPFVALQHPNDLLYAELATTEWRGHEARALRLRPIRGTWRAVPGEVAVSMGSISAYLTQPPDAQMRLELASGTDG